MPDNHLYFPPIGGFRFGMFSIPQDRVFMCGAAHAGVPAS
jgi:hypothetical protein